MKKILALLVFTILAAMAGATIWNVNNNPGMVADFADLSTAFAASQVVNGDTLYVYGSANSYGSQNLYKRLTIIGPGYFLNQNIGLQYNVNSASLSYLALETGSEGSLISGMYISQIDLDVSNIVIQRNWTGRIHCYGSNLMILQNYIQPVVNYSYAIDINGGTNETIANNYIYFSPGYAEWSIYLDDASGGTVYNNVIYGSCRLPNCDVYNNIYGYPGDGHLLNFLYNGNTLLRYNIGLAISYWDWSSYLPGGYGNQYNVMGSVFVGSGSTDGYWQLCAGSPAIGAGMGGVDCGMYGGPTPYKLSGIPAIPAIYNFVAPATGFTIPVQIGARSNN